MSEETRETTRLPRTQSGIDPDNLPLRLVGAGRPNSWRRRKEDRLFREAYLNQTTNPPRAVEPRRAKGMWVPTWLFWLWWVLVLVPSALLVYESVVGW